MNSITNLLKIKLDFSLENTTSFAGLLPILQYCKKTKFREKFKALDILKGSNSIYPFSFILEYLIVGWLASSKRLSHFQSIEQDPLFKKYFGNRCPHHTLLNKEYRRMSRYRVGLYLKNVLMETASPLLPSEILLDLDSTVETVYGHQEGAEVGMNSTKPGRKSYHPLIATEGISRTCLNAELRSGKAHTASKVKDFLQETLSLLPRGVNIKYLRFDKGFAGEDFYSYIEDVLKIGYTGKLKKTSRISEILRNQIWCRVVQEDGWIIEETEFEYQATTWKKPRRVVAIRKTEADPWEGDQLCLPELDWKEEVIVTDLKWQPLDIWKFYNQRACMENYIKEAKQGFYIDHIPTDDFHANEADLFLKLIAYNLFEQFKQRVCDHEHQRYTINRFRREFIALPGKFVSHAKSFILKMPKASQHQASRLRMYERILQLE